MQLLNIPFVFDSAFNCIDTLVVSFCLWYGRNYTLMFSESWDFDFIEPGSTQCTSIGHNILTYTKSREDLLEEYHGIRINPYNPCNFKELLHIIKNELSVNHPVAVNIDTFWCHWFDGNYQHLHSPHYILIFGLDEIKSCFYCLDGQMELSEVDLSFYDCENGFGEILTFSILSEEKIVYDWHSIIKNQLNKFIPESDKNMFTSMRNFVTYIDNNLDFKNEFAGFEHNPTQSPFFQQINDIGRGRKKFAVLINYIIERYKIHELAVISESLNKVGEQWNSVFKLFIKSLYMEDFSDLHKRIIKILFALIEYEESISRQLIIINETI